MALVLKDRVKETTTTIGTGTLTLLGASIGYQSFAAIGDGNTCYYAISTTEGTQWEVGVGTYSSSGTTLSRNTILESSTGGGAIDLAAGTKDVYVVYPAEKGIWLDASGNAIGLGTPAAFVGTNITGTASGLTAGNVTTNANLTGPITSVGNATSIASQTGTGTKFVVDNTPTLITPVLGVATGTSLTVTAALTGAQILASNGLIINNMTVGTTYEIPSGYSASSVGPAVVSSGVTVTVPSGSRWVIL
jgi:hypothetical protein